MLGRLGRGGPFLQLPAGHYRLEIRGDAGTPQMPAEPVLGVEIISRRRWQDGPWWSWNSLLSLPPSGAQLAWRDFTSAELRCGAASFDFNVPTEVALEGSQDIVINPAGIVRMENGTAAVVGYRSKPAFLSMPPEKFEQYLRDEGLDTVLAARTQRGESKQPSREIYSRCAKTLLGVRGDFSRPFGFRLELTPESLAANRVVVRLDYESHPLANALVIAMHRDDPSLRIRIRSDAHGRATFSLPKTGVWLIKSVHMIDAPPTSGAEWESLWASLTFEN
jgi:hypothetical protein